MCGCVFGGSGLGAHIVLVDVGGAQIGASMMAGSVMRPQAERGRQREVWGSGSSVLKFKLDMNGGKIPTAASCHCN
jgi:hypothetical protein